MNQNPKAVLFPSVRSLTLAAMFAAMGVVIGLFCKNFNLMPGVRITFENLPVVLSGILFGPIVGGLVGAVADLAAGVLTGQAINPLITVGAALVGVFAGLVPLFIRRRGPAQIVVADILGHLVGSMTVKTVALYLMLGPGILWRIPIELAVIVVEILILCFLFSRRSFCRLIDRFSNKKA